MYTIGFVGTGNMGGALIKGILKSKQYKVFVYDIVESSAEKFTEYGAVKVSNISDLNHCDYIILTVKPNVYKSVLEQIAASKYKNCIITVAPGITINQVKQVLPDCRIIRTMPNTPALVGEGVVLISNETNNEKDCEDIIKIFSSVGKTSFINENLMNAGVSLSGSSPAFVYELINAIADGAVLEGIPKSKAVEIAAQTVLGSAKMVLETGIHPIVLKDNVCSPGGTTIEAMNVLESEGFKSAVIKAMKACTEKSKKLSQ